MDYPRQLIPPLREPAYFLSTTVIDDEFTQLTITITRTLEPSVPTTKSTATPTSDITRTLTTESSSSRSSSTRTSIIEEPTSSPSPSVEATSTSSQTASTSDTTPIVSPIPSSSTTSAPDASGAISAPLPSGTIAGVVIAVLILVLGLGLFLCWFRRRRQGSRVKSPRWLEGTVGKFTQNGYSQNVHSGRDFAPSQSQFIPAQPPVSYRNDTPIAATYSTSLASGQTASVKLTFVPSLPDELPITNGETLQIIQEFDDGWALCVKADGSEGMVPMECLVIEGGLTPPRAMYSARRVSSLSASGIRYL